uniref:Fe2OG dioxygenase domain-containing protein n=1 Tax=Calcidiscus leptoporus TaxID=127549 RepID=A0A7S0JIE8_9EUKA|mmetsp:Transcript_60199/g.138099  ORF Transcript_60199/g.138099 Transcript_60199/m.138099 type:complete len:323 (+) Transcript_60199:51-1019(+)
MQAEKALARRYAVLLSCVHRTAYALAHPRFAHVAAAYEGIQRHPSLFTPNSVRDWLHPTFVAWLDNGGGDAGKIAREEASEIYSFPLLSTSLCEMLRAEIDHFHASGLEARRPNSMNNYGLILNDIGLRQSLSALQMLVAPLARSLFPTEGASLDDHHSFVVSYREGEDLGLDMHTDDSDVTLNVCLGDVFDGAGLTFCGDVGSPQHRFQSFQYQHQIGRGLLHLGRRRHGADDLRSGHRTNLIMWNYNRAYREAAQHRSRVYLPEAAAPDPQCVSYTHDRDYAQVRGDYPPGKARHALQAWCPPPRAEYPAFRGSSGRYAR